MRALVPFEELVGCPELADAGVEVALYSGEHEQHPPAEGVEFFVLPSRRLPATLGLLPGLPDLKVVQLLSSGADHVLAHVPTGVRVCNAPSLHAQATAEVGISLILASLNHVPAWVAAQHRGEWHDPGPRPMLSGKTVLLLGYGAVGEALATMLAGFGVRLLRVARRARPGIAPVSQFPDLLPDADVVVVAAALTDQTRGLVDDGVLRRMRDGALLVNLSRGQLVDTGALLSHLQSGRIRAALDVTDPEPLPPDHPLWTCPGVLISPHVGGRAADFRDRAVTFVRDQVRRYAAGSALWHVVTGPAV